VPAIIISLFDGELGAFRVVSFKAADKWKGNDGLYLEKKLKLNYI
jgi:hypothetical protein